MSASESLYRRHRFPSDIISQCVWLYFRFSLSFRDVEELMSSRGVSLTYETVREWCLKFGQIYANDLRRKSPRAGDRWHLDEVFLKINGRSHFLWRAVDQDGDVLDILVQSKRNKKAAKKFFRKLLKGLRYVPGYPDFGASMVSKTWSLISASTERMVFSKSVYFQRS